MIMRRKIRTLLYVPALPETLDSAWSESDDIRLCDAIYKDRTKNSYDRHLNTHPLTEMEEGNQVRMKTDCKRNHGLRLGQFANVIMKIARTWLKCRRGFTTETGDTCNLPVMLIQLMSAYR